MGSSPGSSSYDCSFKVLLIGDSAVGKSSLLVSFVSAAPADDDISPTIGNPSYSCLSLDLLLCLCVPMPVSISENSSNKCSCLD
jgi:hypothetical protein